MALVEVKTRVCDRCPTGKERPATRTENISIGSTRWRMELCEGCGAKLEREIFSWGRLGEQLEDRVGPACRGGYDVEQQRHTAELRAAQTKIDRDARIEITPDPMMNNIPSTGLPVGLPVSAGDWIFSQHAIERLTERGVRVIDALRAASQPKVRRPGRGPGVWVQYSNGVKVVVNRQAMRILTVAKETNETEEHDNASRAISQ